MKSINDLVKSEMSKIKIITFPKSEHVDIKNRFDQNKTVHTIRVSKEFGKFKKDLHYKTQWGDIVKVKEKEVLHKIEDYIFYNQLDKNTIKLLKQYSLLDHLQLIKV